MLAESEARLASLVYSFEVRASEERFLKSHEDELIVDAIFLPKKYAGLRGAPMIMPMWSNRLAGTCLHIALNDTETTIETWPQTHRNLLSTSLVLSASGVELRGVSDSRLPSPAMLQGFENVLTAANFAEICDNI